MGNSGHVCLFTSRDSLESTIRHRDFFPILPKGGGSKGRGQLETSIRKIRDPPLAHSPLKNPSWSPRRSEESQEGSPFKVSFGTICSQINTPVTYRHGKLDHLKMYFLHKIVIFHCHGSYIVIYIIFKYTYLK